MTDFETIDCRECGESFKVHPGSHADETKYCSPRCHERGEGLTT